jgi:RHS repeat-associated protein
LTSDIGHKYVGCADFYAIFSHHRVSLTNQLALGKVLALVGLVLFSRQTGRASGAAAPSPELALTISGWLLHLFSLPGFLRWPPRRQFAASRPRPRAWGNDYTVNAGHTYAEEGNFTVTTTVTQQGGDTITTVTGPATVKDAALTPGSSSQPLNGRPGVSLTGVAPGNGGVLWVTAAGDSRFFASNGDGTFATPPEDFGTLVQDPNTGIYTYVAKDQTRTYFNAQGLMNSVVDTHGLARIYGYDSLGRLVQVAAPDGGITVLTYSPVTGLLATIAEPGGRLLQVGHDSSSNLTSILDVDNSTRAFGYAGHYLTSDQWAPLSAGFTYDATTGLLTGVNRGLGTSYAIVSAAASGLAGAVNGPGLATVTDGLLHTTSYFLDQRGRLLSQILPDGATNSNVRDAHGQLIIAVDALGVPTLYTYAYGPGDGDLVQTTYANGLVVLDQYDPIFHHLTVESNDEGETTSNTYDPSTGDLLSSTDALGNTTAYAWSAGLLQSMTDPRHAMTRYLYDADRRLSATIDPLDNWTVQTYDPAGNPASTTDALMRVTLTLYSGRNLLLQTTDANGGITSQTYNAYGEQTSQTDARRFTSSTTYDVRGWATMQTDALLAHTYTYYDVAGNVSEAVDADGNAMFYSYDVDNRQTGTLNAYLATTATTYDAVGDVLTSTDEPNRTTVNTYDGVHRLVASIDPMLRTSYTKYDLLGNVLVSIDGRGEPTLYGYDLDNRQIAVQDARGDTSYTLYDPAGNVAATIDSRGQITYYSYDADNRQVATLDPDLLTTQTFYDAAGNVIQTIDSRNQSTFYGYDVLNRQTRVTDPNNNITRTVYDPNGNVVKTVDANNRLSFTNYDGDNRPVRVQDADGHVSTTVYDPAGNVIAEFDNNNAETDTWYDLLNRPYLMRDPNGNFSQTAYSPVGDVLATADGNNHVTALAYDGDDEQTGQRQANGAVTLTAYNLDGQVSGVADPDGNQTLTFYDAAGNLAAVLDPNGHVTSYLYNQDNQLLTKIDRNGRRINYGYDNAGRLLSETWLAADGVTVLDTLSYSYDGDGNLLTASNHYGTYSYTYDNAGRVHTQTDPFGLVLTYGYDSDGNVTSVSDSLGGVVASGYDANGWLTTRQFSGPGGVQARFDPSYTADGQVATETRYSDTAGTHKVGLTQDTYDAANNLTHLKQQNGSGAPLADYGYTFDAANQLTSKTEGGTQTNFGYDNAGQLTSGGGTNYSYDPNGNRTMAGYQTGPDNRLVSDGVWNYTYDNENNVIQKVRISDGLTWAYTWDNDNRMLSATQTLGNGTLVTRVTMQYDVLGNRVEEDVFTQSTGQTAVQRFAWDGSNLWAELNGSNQLQTRRLYDDAGQVVAKVSAAGAVSWLVADYLGSIRLITDATGAVQDTLAYYAYGNLVSESSPGNGDADKYAGYRWDGNVSFYGTDWRWYDPLSARWMQEDPIGFGAGDSNLDRYVGNSPTNAVDPSGLAGFNLPSLDRWQNAAQNLYLGGTGPGQFQLVSGLVQDEVDNILTTRRYNARREANGQAPEAFQSVLWAADQAGGLELRKGLWNNAVGIYNIYQENKAIESDLAHSLIQDVSVQLNQMGLIKDVHQYEPTSTLFGGFDQAKRLGYGGYGPGEQGAAAWQLDQLIGSIPLVPLGTSFAEGVETGNYSHYQQQSGANAFWTAMAAFPEMFGRGSVPGCKMTAKQQAFLDMQREAIRSGDPIPGIHEPGPFAREGIPTQSGASSRGSSITRQNNANGNANGCHICGARDPGTPNGAWIKDHIPATRLTKPGDPQMIHPSCQTCSNEQGWTIRNLRALRTWFNVFGE